MARLRVPDSLNDCLILVKSTEKVVRVYCKNEMNSSYLCVVNSFQFGCTFRIVCDGMNGYDQNVLVSE